MEISVVDRNVDLTAEQKELVDRQIAYSFDRFETHIRLVEVLFNDVNGPKGGSDIQCRVRLLLHSKGEVLVEGRDDSVEAAVAGVIDRASIAVARRIERLKDSQGTSMSGQ